MKQQHARVTAVNNVIVNSEMQVSLKADITEKCNLETGELSKTCNGIEVNARVVDKASGAVLEGQGLTLSPESATLNGGDMQNVTKKGTTFYV